VSLEPDEPNGERDEHRWRLLLDAVVTMAGGRSLDELLTRIVEVARDLAGARYAALGVLDDKREQRLRLFVTSGISEDVAAGIGDPPTGRGVLGLLIDHPEPVRLHDIQSHPQSYGFPPNHPPMHSFLGVPVRTGERIFGNLYLSEKIGGGDFTDADEEMVIALAGAAGVVVENALLQEERARLAVFEDRDRIGRDLHDIVIQRLFAIGLRLQSGLRWTQDPRLTERIDEAVDEIDTTIREIRQTIFDLSTTPKSGDLQTRITNLVDRVASQLKFRPSLSFDGPIRLAVGADLGNDVVAVLREVLSNAARHAQASAVSVEVSAGDRLVVRVRDNGVGVPADATESGLANLRRRAAAHGGVCTISDIEPSGTLIEWSVPLR
jgi:signal transduction histidine kinase